jgi:hypothetical protein
VIGGEVKMPPRSPEVLVVQESLGSSPCRINSKEMEVAVGLEPTKTGFAGQRLDHFGIATSTLKIQSG